MSFKPQVRVNGQWSSNGLAFATKFEADGSAIDLMTRWTLVEDARSIESDEPVNYALVDGKLYSLEDAPVQVRRV